MNHYRLYKQPMNGQFTKFSVKYVHGFHVKPKNSITDAIQVDDMVVINPTFINKVVKRKVKHKLDQYLQYIITIVDDEGADPTGMRQALDDLDRYKKTIQNKYRYYLEEKYLELLFQKIAFIEHELQSKLYIKEYERQQQLFREQLVQQQYYHSLMDVEKKETKRSK